MATLAKRVQVLFDPERYALLEREAQALGMSVGAFIRETVDERLDAQRSDKVAILQEMFARADADAAQHDYPPFDWEEARADYEREMDPMERLRMKEQGLR